MSPASTGRYQSRLFNFLNRQSIRLTDQFNRTVRHIKVAATWGTQILLYPVYLLVQAGLSAGRQLSSAAQTGSTPLKAFSHSQPQETAPTVDTPIQRVLEDVSILELPIASLKEQLNVEKLEGWNVQNNLPSCLPATQTNLQPANPPSETPLHLNQTEQELSHEHCLVRGVATLLTTRTLVLVTVQNQVLDILTPEQQQKLSARIIWEVSDFLHQRRLVQVSERQVVPHRLANLDRPRVFLPVRLFWQVMAWVQTSPVAIAANLFQECTLVHHKPMNGGTLDSWNIQNNLLTYQPTTLQPSNPLQGVLDLLDHTAAELESHQLVPGTEGAIVLYERATQALRDRTQKLRQHLQPPFVTPGRPGDSLETSQTNPFRIQALIYAAINYFFGRHASNLPGIDSPEQLTIPANPQETAHPHQLAGLNSTSLPPLVNGKNSESQTQLPEALNSKIPAMPGNSVWGVFKRYLSFKPSPGKLSEHPPTSVGTTANLTPQFADTTSTSPVTKASQANSFRIQALIHAAINYFFGRSSSNLPSTGSQEQSAISADPQGTFHQISGHDSASLPPVTSTHSDLADDIEADPWLSWDDLFSNPIAQTSSKTGELTLQFHKRQGETTATKRQTPSSKLVSSPNTNKSLGTTTTAAITNPSAPSSDAHLDPAPDWIETEASPVGYVKHPLEQILAWLDLTMLWIEELVVKVWRWLTRS
ncbi:MAG: hypothetical protein LDL41_01030 [Coleofasciculus sp. S288]|nr:hypothetical protein [Coleofasciculus sp. S288]